MNKVYVFCNGCDRDWHPMMALGDDGTFLASHICSDHAFADHDMGIDSGGWKRDKYAEHFPNGFTVEWVENSRTHSGLLEAYVLNQKRCDRPDCDECKSEARAP